VDIKRTRLAYLTDLQSGVSVPTFSADGRLLAASGRSGGVLLDLRTFRESRLDGLAGTAVGFSSDGKYLLLGTSSDLGREKPVLRFLTLKGEVEKEYPLDMVVARTIRSMGNKVAVVGWGGRPFSRKAGMGFEVTQVFDMRTGASSRSEDRARRSNGGAEGRLLPACEIREPYRNYFSDLFWDESSGIAVVRGEGPPEGGVLKVWDIRKGRFLGTPGTHNEINDLAGFVRPGVLAAQMWSEGEKRLVELDLSDGSRGFPADAKPGVSPYSGSRHSKGSYGGMPEPIPVGNGRVALQPEGTTMRLHVVGTADGRRLATFVPFAGKTWIIHTAEGKWCGSEDILEHVSFYRGRELLDPSVIAGLRSSEGVESFLRQHVGQLKQ
jgi:hypothetical protein